MGRDVSTTAREPVAGVLERAPEPGAPAAVHAEAVLAVPHHIVVVGGGAGGLVLATKLGDRLGRRGEARITLVDCALTHIWKPLLHEVAAGTLRTDTDGLDYFAHARAHHFAFELGEMRGLDRARREVILDPVTDASGAEIVPGRRLGYDTLVIAVGSVLNDFGVPGVREHCLFLDSPAGGRAHPPAGVRPLPARPRRGRLGLRRGGCASRSSAPAPPGSSSRPNCATPRASWSATACAASIPTATSRCA